MAAETVTVRWEYEEIMNRNEFLEKLKQINSDFMLDDFGEIIASYWCCIRREYRTNKQYGIAKRALVCRARNLVNIQMFFGAITIGTAARLIFVWTFVDFI